MSGSLPLSQMALTATASVRTHRFIKQTGEATGTECTSAGERALGVSVPFTDRIPSDTQYPGTPADTVANGAPLAAVTGRGIPYYGIPGMQCEVVVGSGGVTAGAEVATDANGAGVVATASQAGVWVLAKAIRAASAGELVPVILQAPYQLQVATNA